MIAQSVSVTRRLARLAVSSIAPIVQVSPVGGARGETRRYSRIWGDMHVIQYASVKQLTAERSHKYRLAFQEEGRNPIFEPVQP